jgi:hypothetical protein
MSGENSKMSLKQKAAHDFKEFVVIFLCLAFFFCAVGTYKMLLLNEFRDSYLNYSFALINGLVGH